MAQNLKKSTDYDKISLSENIEKNFILIMKPREWIDAEENNSLSEISTRTVLSILDQIFEELRERNILENEAIKDIRFIILEYLDNMNVNIVQNTSLSCDCDQFEDGTDYWNSPYEIPDSVKIDY